MLPYFSFVLLCLSIGGCSLGIDGFVQQLAHPNENVRVYAVEKLGASGRAEAVQPLIGALSDEKRRVRLAAIDALGVLGDARAVDALAPLLNEGHPALALATIEAMGQIGGTGAVDALLEIVTAGVPTMRVAAMDALGQIGDARAVDVLCAQAWDKSPDVRRVAAVALGRIGEAGSIGVLTELLADADEKVQRAALFVLDRIDAHWRDRSEAALARGRFLCDVMANEIAGNEAALARYCALRGLKALDADWQQRDWAGAVMDHFVVRLRDADVAVRRVAARVLGDLGDGRVVDVLLGGLKDADRGVRQAVVMALGNIGDARAIGPLREVLSGGDMFTKGAAAFALGALRDTGAVNLLIAQLTPEVLAQRSGHPGWDVPLRVAEALGKVGDPRGVAALIGLLQNERVSVRVAAARSLGQIGDGRVAGTLMDALADGDPQVRNAAVWALGQIGDDRSVDVLMVRLGAGVVDNGALIAALGRLDGHWHRRAQTRIAELAQVVAERDDAERVSAAVVLAQAGGDVADGALLQALRRRDLKVVGAAHRYYIRQGVRDAVPALIQALEGYGDEALMAGLLGSGHPALEKAARAWAHARGMALVSWPEDQMRGWGGG